MLTVPDSRRCCGGFKRESYLSDCYIRRRVPGKFDIRKYINVSPDSNFGKFGVIIMTSQVPKMRYIGSNCFKIPDRDGVT